MSAKKSVSERVSTYVLSFILKQYAGGFV